MARKRKNNLFTIISIILVVLIAIFIAKHTYKSSHSTQNTDFSTTGAIPQEVITSLNAPDESKATNNNSYKVLNNNTPYFSKEDLSIKSFENYSNLDNLGRVGQANAVIGVDLMPTNKREEISHIRPSGWQSNKTAHVYDRSHLIAFQLSGENANEKNLMTGTRFMNHNMIPFENQVAEYVKKTKKHVRYRVTPVFKDNDLVAQGVIMEAMSVEDNGADIKYNIFIYNFQKGVNIDYKTGKYTLSK